MVVTKARLVLSLSAMLLILTACPNPYFERVKELVDSAKGSSVVTPGSTQPLFLYSLGISGTGVDVFSLDPVTGTLSHTSTFGLPIPPGGMAIDSIATLMFVTAPLANQVWGFTINPATGALTTTGTPFSTGTAAPGAIYVRRSNDAVYVAFPTSGAIQALSMAASGVLGYLLTVSAGSTPVALVTDVSSQFLYAATGASGGSIYGYTLNPAGTPGVGVPFPASGSPTYVAIDPTGAFLYESDHSTGIVRLWNIDSITGNLTPSFGTPYSVTTNPEKMAVDPSGKYLYITDSVANQVVMARITAGTGALTTGGWVYSTGVQPKGVFVDPSGKFVCVANSGSNSISVFFLDPATGFLTLATTYGPTPSSDPEDILITGTAN